MCVHLTQPQGIVCAYTSHNHKVQYVCTPHTTTRYSMCVHLTQPPGTVCVYTSHNHQVQYVCTSHTTTRYSMCVHLTQPPGTVCVYTSHNHQVQYVCTSHTTTRYSIRVHHINIIVLMWYTYFAIINRSKCCHLVLKIFCKGSRIYRESCCEDKSCWRFQFTIQRHCGVCEYRSASSHSRG